MAGSGVSLARRATGAAIALLVSVPVYRVLSSPETGLAGHATVRAADVTYAFAWSGTLVIVLVALLAWRFAGAGLAERGAAAVARILVALPSVRFAALAGILGASLSAVFVLVFLDGAPTHADAFAQLLHARFVAAGMSAGPTVIDPAFWLVQNGVLTPAGWVSQYPPGHVLLLALGLAAGIPWIVGPAMVGACAYFVARSAERLLPESIALARGGALCVACSPFVVCLGGSFMNHAPTAALLAATTWFALRADYGDARWSYAAGAALGAAFTIRPLAALAIGAAVMAASWLHHEAPLTRASGRFVRALGGASPFFAALAAYNAHFFGSPIRFGYDAALGPATGLGFGLDPWGNLYGPVQALGYTASDLVLLGGALLESPLSPVLAGALLLACAGRLTRGERILAAWALAPVAANALYWHHGLYMGPRMLFEAAPAWLLLAAAALGRGWRVAGEVRRPALRAGMTAAVATGLALALWLAPQRAMIHAPPPGDVTAVRPPAVAGPALVFVHDAWTARLAMRLAATGMRLDSVEAALRQNPTCDVQALADALADRGLSPHRPARPALDFHPRAVALPAAFTIATGSSVRMDPARPPTASCVREALADRNGILDLAPLVWRGDLPGAPPRGTLFVRDLGPERNAALIRREPARRPYLLLTPRDAAMPLAVDYSVGIERLWSNPGDAEAP